MRTRLCNPAGLASIWACALLTIALAPRVLATDLIWTNTGTLFTPPQIDAFSFANSGVISIFTDQPFETSNTRNFTNSGTMSGTPGWYFDNAAAESGYRQMADNFVNNNTAFIEALDPTTTFFVIGAPT